MAHARRRAGRLALYASGGVALGEGIDFRDGDAIEVARNCLLQRAGGDREAKGILVGPARDQRVNQACGKAIGRRVG